MIFKRIKTLFKIALQESLEKVGAYLFDIEAYPLDSGMIAYEEDISAQEEELHKKGTLKPGDMVKLDFKYRPADRIGILVDIKVVNIENLRARRIWAEVMWPDGIVTKHSLTQVVKID